MKTLSFTEKTAIITGAGSDCGRASARMLAQCSVRIVQVHRNVMALAEAMATFEGTGHISMA